MRRVPVRVTALICLASALLLAGCERHRSRARAHESQAELPVTPPAAPAPEVTAQVTPASARATEPAPAPIPSWSERHLFRTAPTTASDVAVRELTAEITALEHARLDNPRAQPAADTARLISLLQERARFIGRLEDDQRAADLSVMLLRFARRDPNAWLARAQVLTRLRRYAESDKMLDRARRLGAGDVTAQRAANREASLGDQTALNALRDLSVLAPSVDTQTALAAALVRRGQFDEAESLSRMIYAKYEGGSPLVVARLEYEHGLLHERRGDLNGAGEWFEQANRRLPEFAAAAGHLAMREEAAGKTDRAVALLRRAYAQSGNPEYAAQLSSVLRSKDPSRADEWLSRAKEGYSARDHGDFARVFAESEARFWLGEGHDPAKALEFAKLNADGDSSKPAQALLLEAALAANSHKDLCGAFTALAGDAHAASPLTYAAASQVCTVAAASGTR